MARLARIYQKIFAGSATNNGQFGSAQVGTKVTSTSLATLMALPAWANGWLDAVMGASKFPPLEEFQALTYIQTSQLAYLFQEGIPEYDSSTTYYTFGIVKKTGTFELYGSLINDNLGNALPAGVSDSNWKFLGDLSNLAGTLPVVDTTAIVKGSSDGTKQMRFEVDGFTPATTRVLTPPDANITLVGQDYQQTLTNKKLSDSTTQIVDNSDNTKQLEFEVSAIATGTTRTVSAPDASGNMLLDIARSIVANGYIKFSNGLIMQWGNQSLTASANTNVTFPLAFPTACLWANASAGVNSNATYPVAVNTFNTTTLNLKNTDGGTTQTAYWHAVGN